MTLNKCMDLNKYYSALEAIELLKNREKQPKFEESIDISVDLGIDVKKSDQIVKSVVNFPNEVGKKKRILVICRPELAQEAIDAGADMVGDASILEKIKQEEDAVEKKQKEIAISNFTHCITTPDMMMHFAKIAKILGPKGIMPNATSGTVTKDIKKTILSVKAGMISYRSDKKGSVKTSVGRISSDVQKLNQNVVAIIESIKNARPLASKGKFIKRVVLSSTMGPGIKIDLSTI